MCLAAGWPCSRVARLLRSRYRGRTPVSRCAAFSFDASHCLISVLKPLAGLDDGLESNLRTFFEQDYPLVRTAVRRPARESTPPCRSYAALQARVSARSFATADRGRAAVSRTRRSGVLHHMTEAARHDMLVMSDSDIRVTPGFPAHDRSRVSGSEARRLHVPVSGSAGRELLVDAWKQSA